jgi:dipeptidyl aminopeptidase/acylaminoacyl peptidase
LATGAEQSWNDVSSFTFNAGSTHLILRHGGGGGGGAPAGRGGGGGRGAAAPAAPAQGGSDVILHDLGSGRDQLLGSVSEISFSSKGDLLSYTVDATAKDANGLFVFDLRSGRINPIDNDAKTYSHMTWNDDGSAIAVLKGSEVTGMREKDNTLIVFPDIPSALGAESTIRSAKLDANVGGFPKGSVVSDRAGLTWSDDGKRVFFGIKEQVPAPDTAGVSQRANVDIWRTADKEIQSQQIQRAAQTLNATFLSGFDVASGKFIMLSDSTMRTLALTADGKWGIGQDTRNFINDYDRAKPDYFRVNTATGERTLFLKAENANAFGTSPDSKYFLYWKDNQFQLYDIEANTSKTITKNVPVNFLDTDYDHPGQKPPFGVTGYTADGKSVILQHKYDQWQVPLDGMSPAKNLTAGLGAKNETRFTYIRTDSAPAGGGGRGGRGGGGGRGSIDLTKPILLGAYGEYTKKAGFYELRDGQMKEIVYDDASYSQPTKAAKADKFLLTRQTFSEFADLRIANGTNFKDTKKITNANPQQDEYLWGHRILFDYKNKKGVRLQGTLAIPDDYKPGEKRPMLVNFYEKNSQNLNRYLAPSYLGSLGSLPMQAVSEGYLIMQPDIYFNGGSSHSDMLDCVEAAVKKVIEMGYVDPKKIGLNGHSYSGEGAAFIGTRSRLFAAVGFGAGVTDIENDFSINWGWTYQIGGTGSNGLQYYEYGQGRWGTDPWTSPALYHFESARTHVPEITAPFLILHGTADPTVSFQEGLGMYNAMRFNKKEAYLLAYPNEGHGLTNLANRRDLTVRYMQFFNHFLKGAPAPKWMTDGVPFIMKDAALKGDPRH